METFKKMLIFAIALGALTTGILGIFILFDFADFQESREAITKILSSIAIGTAVAIIILALSRLAKK